MKSVSYTLTLFKQLEILLSERDMIINSHASIKEQSLIANKIRDKYAEIAIHSVKMSRKSYFKNK